MGAVEARLEGATQVATLERAAALALVALAVMAAALEPVAPQLIVALLEPVEREASHRSAGRFRWLAPATFPSTRGSPWCCTN